MAKRFITEYGINMFASWSALFQDEHVAKLEEITKREGIKCHIYMIGARPRISVDPSKFSFSESTFSGTFIVHEGPNQTECPFEAGQHPTQRLDGLRSDWPHTYVELLSGPDVVLRGKAALLAYPFPALHPYMDTEVLYVGQAYGIAGERGAEQRLQSHSTLQRILGESARLHPDQEVWLALFEFQPILITTIDGRLGRDPEALRADDERPRLTTSTEVSEQQRVSFTEAALIRYFDPIHNKTFRESFPSPAHKTYAECYEVDLNMVSVEIDTEHLHTRLYSSTRLRSWRHMAMYPLHNPAERDYMLDLLGPGTGPSSVR